MDPTSAWVEIRDMIRCYQEGHPVDTGRLLDLWEGMDRWMTRGGHMPEQWTSPTEFDPDLHRGVAAVVTDPAETVTELREHGAAYPAEPGRMLALLAGLDRWIIVDCDGLPPQWLTNR